MTAQQAQNLLSMMTAQNNYLTVIVGILACIVGVKVLTWLLRW